MVRNETSVAGAHDPKGSEVTGKSLLDWTLILAQPVHTGEPQGAVGPFYLISVHIAQMCHAAPLGLPVTSQGPSQLAPGWVLPSTRTSFLGALQELLSILESSLLTSLFNNHEMCLGHCALLLNNII